MQEIMIAIVLGIAVGCSDLLNYNVKKWLSRFSTVSLFIMLLCLGAKIGCDAELLGNWTSWAANLWSWQFLSLAAACWCCGWC